MSQVATKFKYVVTLNVEHFCGKRRTATPEGIRRRGLSAIRQFKKAVTAVSLLVEFSDGPATITEDNAILTLSCDHWISNAVRVIPGVLILERAPVRRLPR